MKKIWFLLFSVCAIGSVHAASLPFQTANVEFRDVDQTYAAEGLVEAVNQSTVSAEIAGRIVQLNFDVGDYVKKGEIIARIDESVVGQQLAGSRAQVAQAQAQLENARANYERTRQLFQQKFVSQAALDKAQTEYKAAQAQASATLAGAGAAAATRNFATIIAPYSGVVSARHVELGEMATPGKPIMTGFDPKDLRVEVTVPQYKLQEVKESNKAMVEFPAIGKWVQATEVNVLPSADVKTHATRVRLNLPENTRDVYPGMFARAYFSVGHAKKLLIPAQAVLRRSEVTAVYVVDKDNKIQLRQVRLGEPQVQGFIEILAGLSPGDKVALDPVKAGIYLKENQH